MNLLQDLADGPKDARMEFRTKRHIKETIQAAAALSGVDDGAFAIGAAYKAALETIRAHETTVLSPNDRQVFLHALDSPVEPTDVLKGAAKLHATMIGHGG